MVGCFGSKLVRFEGKAGLSFGTRGPFNDKKSSGLFGFADWTGLVDMTCAGFEA